MPALALSLALLACEQPVEITVGDLDETDARVAIAVRGELAEAYVCGGEETIESYTRWFTGEVWGGSVDLESGGWTLVADLGAPTTGGLISPDGEELTFSINDQGSLFESSEFGCRTGAVLGPDKGGQLFLQGVWCDEIGALSQVTPVSALSLEMESVSVQAETSSGLVSFEMTRVSP